MTLILMRRLLWALVLFAAGVLASWWIMREQPFVPPDAPTLIASVQTAARLETLDVRLYKKVSFAPDPVPRGSIWGDVANWLKHSIHAPSGRAIVFAEVHYGVDLSQLSAEDIHVQGKRIAVLLPPVQIRVELLPGETEIIGSNLNSEQTAELFELAKRGFEADARADAVLRSRARTSAELAVEHALRRLGFQEVVFRRLDSA